MFNNRKISKILLVMNIVLVSVSCNDTNNSAVENLQNTQMNQTNNGKRSSVFIINELNK